MKFNLLLNRIEMKKVLGGDELRKLRHEVCYKQEYMANQLGISQSTYQRIESGEIKISLERLIKISEILNKPIENFSNENKNEGKSDPYDELNSLIEIILRQEIYIKEMEEKLRLIS